MPMRLAQGVGLGRPGIRMRGGVPSSLLNGLLGYWSLEGNSLNRVTGLTGTDTAVTYSAGKVGQGAGLDGTSSTIATGVAGPTGAAPRTMALWVYRASTAVSVVCEYGTAAPLSFFQFYANSAGGVVLSDGTNLLCPTTLTAGEWTHLVATYDGANVVVYRNGVAGTPSAALTFTTGTTVPFLMGSHAGAYFFSGLLDEVALSNRVWTEAEVLVHYNSGAGRAWPF